MCMALPNRSNDIEYFQISITSLCYSQNTILFLDKQIVAKGTRAYSNLFKCYGLKNRKTLSNTQTICLIASHNRVPADLPLFSNYAIQRMRSARNGTNRLLVCIVNL